MVSVWQPFFLASKDGDAVLEAANELEELGYHRIWFSASLGAGVPARYGEILGGTKRIGVAPGILSIWHCSPDDAAAATAQLEQAHPGRFLLGLGASHASLVEGNGEKYRRPYSKMVEFLDALDTAGVAVDQRVLAALGPRMMELSRNRAAGAHPYFVPAEHTAEARGILGEQTLLAPEVAVVLDPNPETARATARQYMSGYLQLPNYTRNLIRLGWPEDELADDGSDRLVDALIPWGDIDQVAAGLRAHYEAGADEVTIQVLGVDRREYPAEAFRALAGALIS
jgi:probable F420-dependent oxidoreductase